MWEIIIVNIDNSLGEIQYIVSVVLGEEIFRKLLARNDSDFVVICCSKVAQEEMFKLWMDLTLEWTEVFLYQTEAC